MKQIIILLRPHQWIKNGILFVPLFFSRHILDVAYLLPCIVAFMAFCMASSGIYCLNDAIDADNDRIHPVKCKRPIASCAISKSWGYGLMVVCLALSVTILAIGHADARVYGLTGFYFLLNIAYCLCLKRQSIVDVFVIAIGFVLRLYIGSFASGVMLTHWIVLMTFLLALFLAFAKRRDDVVIYEETGVQLRKNTKRYNLSFLNSVISIIASITMVCYVMYTVSPEVIARFGSPYVYVTSLFVLAGIIRYLQVTVVDVKSGSPTRLLLKDHFLQTCIAGWILTFVILLYL